MASPTLRPPTFLILSTLAALLVPSTAARSRAEFAPAKFYALFGDSPAIHLTANSPRFSGKNSSEPCACSPSARGHPPLFHTGIQEFIALLQDFSTLNRTSLRYPILTRRLTNAERALIARYGMEGYINLDAALRALVPKTQCAYDRKTGRNLYPVKRTPNGLTFISLRTCDQFQDLASPATVRKKFVPSPGPDAPVPSASARNTSGRPSTGTDVTDLGAVPSPAAASPSPAEALPIPSRAPVASLPSGPAVSGAAVSSPTASPAPANEGCVAIEHLDGYAVQHGVHLQRSVLCSRGFCATPNHAIIVDGVWTSMKRLCADGWKCTEDVRLVNNLKISESTRLRIDDHIVITPYDARFPIVLPWVVQIVEDILAIVMLSLKVSALLVLTICSYTEAHRHQRKNKMAETKTVPSVSCAPGASCAATIRAVFPVQAFQGQLAVPC